MRLARPNPLGPRSQLSFPLTWGGERRAGVQLEKYLEHGTFRRVELGGAVSRQVNPFYDESDRRNGVGSAPTLDRRARFVRTSDTGWEDVSFGDQADRLARVGAGVSVDTRIDPFLARNAIYARAAWELSRYRVRWRSGALALDVSAYAGLIGQAVLVARGARDDATGSRPDYLKPLIGWRRDAARLPGWQRGRRHVDVRIARAESAGHITVECGQAGRQPVRGCRDGLR